MHAIYMRSVRSPGDCSGGTRGRYKLAYNHNTHLDVFSQRPPGGRHEEESQYLEDSFCVGDHEDAGTHTRTHTRHMGGHSIPQALISIVHCGRESVPTGEQHM